MNAWKWACNTNSCCNQAKKEQTYFSSEDSFFLNFPALAKFQSNNMAVNFRSGKSNFRARMATQAAPGETLKELQVGYFLWSDRVWFLLCCCGCFIYIHPCWDLCCVIQRGKQNSVGDNLGIMIHSRAFPSLACSEENMNGCETFWTELSHGLCYSF